jgi:hypothetical protein
MTAAGDGAGSDRVVMAEDYKVQCVFCVFVGAC